jgi:hypothetical protein
MSDMIIYTVLLGYWEEIKLYYQNSKFAFQCWKTGWYPSATTPFEFTELEMEYDPDREENSPLSKGPNP